MNKNDRYRPMRFKERQHFERYLDKINRAACIYEEKFNGKSITFNTRNRKIELNCTASNFMHLCGVFYKKNGAKAFYRAALSKNIKLESVWIKKDYSTFEKLKVIDQIGQLLADKVSLVHSGRLLYLQFDYALRTRKQLLALTLKDINSVEIPQSLLNLRRVNNFAKGEKVISITIKNK